MKRWLADETNRERRAGGPADVIEGTDLFVGLSGARVIARRGARRDGARRDGLRHGQPDARGLARGGRALRARDRHRRSDYPNQINNVLCFPGIFRGALDVRAREITEPMKMAAAGGIAAIVGDDELREDHVIPSPFNRDVAPAVADAVARRRARTGEAQSRPAEVRLRGGRHHRFPAVQDYPIPAGASARILGDGADC